MASTKAAEETEAFSPDDLVEFTIPRTGPNDTPVFLGVNGETIRVVPGVPVKVKRKFVEVWQHHQEQEVESWKTDAKLKAASRKALADL